MGQTKEQRIIKQVVGKPTNQKFTPVATDMFLPNHSGITSHPEFKEAIAAIPSYTDADAVSAVAAADDYLKNDGDTGAGNYIFNGNRATSSSAFTITGGQGVSAANPVGQTITFRTGNGGDYSTGTKAGGGGLFTFSTGSGAESSDYFGGNGGTFSISSGGGGNSYKNTGNSLGGNSGSSLFSIGVGGEASTDTDTATGGDAGSLFFFGGVGGNAFISEFAETGDGSLVGGKGSDVTFSAGTGGEITDPYFWAPSGTQGGDGGTIRFYSGGGGVDTINGNNGADGDIIFIDGYNNNTFKLYGDGSGLIEVGQSWTANGTGTVTISNLAPAGVGTATISKWLTISDGSNTYYIPAWT